ncbi:hypothetical protein LIER_23092 [Lithospermum erythrorhizon]|uniref:Reverse transcriptase domain-containing protein n=1 Tax=Lithospermum erythrorhizon TaxID=34254 RepID=A0AAV3QWE6_LITER
MAQFRSIALCNTIAKIIFKALALRLKKYLPIVISDTQSAFIPKRNITDNVLLAYEAHHMLKSKKSGKVGYMSIKLDMLKAYDRIEWRFLRAMLIQLKFPPKWISLIMEYVESVSYSVLVNGQQAGFIKPGRGVCLRGVLSGIPMGKNVDPMTHLMFANDTLLLGQVTVVEATAIKQILDTYETWSGQLVSSTKSTIMFSRNMDGATRTTTTATVGMPKVQSHGKNLGLLTTIGFVRNQ